MEPIRVRELDDGGHSLTLEAGQTAVDRVISELGHEANGYFWQGVVELLVGSEARELDGTFSSDPEGGAYYAYSADRGALDRLALLLRQVATDEGRLRGVVRLAVDTGFEFDD